MQTAGGGPTKSESAPFVRASASARRVPASSGCGGAVLHAVATPHRITTQHVFAVVSHIRVAAIFARGGGGGQS